LSFEYFKQVDVSGGVNINSRAVVCFYSDLMREGVVNVELSNGSKFTLKTTLSAVENWPQRSA
jgi:hypothetical protein